MIPITNQLRNTTSKTFAHNWLKNMDSVMQLILSDQIWQRQNEAKPNEQIQIDSKTFHPEDGLTQVVYYLNNKAVLMVSESLGENPEIPVHQTLVI